MSVHFDAERSKGNKRAYYFRCTYIDQQGNRHRHKSGRFPTASAAKEAEAKFLAEKDKPIHSSLTFNAVIDEVLDQKKGTVKLVTWEAFEVKTRYIREDLGDVKIAKLTQTEYKRFLENLKNNGNTPTYNNKVLSAVKNIVEFADLHHNVRTRVPWMFPNFKDVNASKRKRLTKDKFYTLDEYMQFRDAIDSPVYLALFDVLFFQGLRIGEADALLWTDVDLSAGTLSISKTVCTKKRDASGRYLVTSPKTESSNRVIAVNSTTLESLKALRNYWERFEAFDESWNIFGGIDALPNSTIHKEKKRILTKANEKAPLKEINLHGFRHSAASLMVQASPSEIPAISAYLGHSTITMTLNTYVGIHQDKFRTIVADVDKFAQIE